MLSLFILLALKTSAAFHEQRRSLERARTEDYLKRKIRSRPEKSELIRMHILEEPFLQVKQLKKACLAVDLNDKIAQRPGPMELIHKNILPVHSSIKQAFIGKASGENSSFDEDTNDSLSPEQSTSVSEEGCSLGLGPLPTPKETQTGHGIPSPTQVGSLQRVGLRCCAECMQDCKSTIKKLKYHQYIPPDQKGDKEPPPHLDSSYAKILQQQQLFLQLQILSQQQQRYHTILPAPTKAPVKIYFCVTVFLPSRSQTAQQPSSSSKSMHTSSSPPRPAGAPLDFSKHLVHTCLSSVPLGGTKPVSLPPNLDEMKVAELKSELKLRNLPVSGTKNDLIERLRTYQELKSPATAAAAQHPESDAGESARPAETLSAEKEKISKPAKAAPAAVTTAASAVKARATDAAEATASAEATKVAYVATFMSSPLNQLSLQPSSVAQLSTNVKEEPRCSTPTPSPVLSVDKDRLLQEKDKQIEALTRMLWQKQRLVEVLKMQLENGDRGKAPEPISPLGVKEEPLDEPDVAFSMDFDRFPSQKSPISQEMDITKVIVKQEVIEEEEVKPEKTFQSPITHGLPQSSTQTQEEHLAQQHIIQKVLLQQQQHNIQNQTLENQHDLQKLYSSACSLPPSPLQVLLPLSPPFPPSCGTPHPDPSLQPELQTVADTTGQKQHLSHAESGRLEDFLESTTGRPLLGVEPGGLLSLIDDLHNQMLCTSSILNHPLSPMDTSDTASWEQGLDSMDWLNLTTERDREEESPSLALQTPPSVFSTDFLDSSDLHIHSEFSL
uniref:Myocardin-related transcription factor B-like n=1 Tax=Neolamprologus brichardi TaxID=32507 RepID=A0A3Q4GF16_NEOBR